MRSTRHSLSVSCKFSNNNEFKAVISQVEPSECHNAWFICLWCSSMFWFFIIIIDWRWSWHRPIRSLSKTNHQLRARVFPRLCRVLIGLFDAFNQSEAGAVPIIFPRLIWRRPRSFVSTSDWFIWSSPSVVIGQIRSVVVFDAISLISGRLLWLWSNGSVWRGGVHFSLCRSVKHPITYQGFPRRSSDRRKSLSSLVDKETSPKSSCKT